MSKKIKAVIPFLFLIGGLCACGEKTSTQTSEDDVSTIIESTHDSFLEDSSTSVLTEIDEETTDVYAEYYDWDKLKLYLPSWLKYENVYGYNVYSGSLNSNDKIYYHFASSGYYDESRDDFIEGYTFKDAPNIIGYSLDKVVYEFYPYFDDKYSVSIDSEEEVESNGFPFIKRTGVIHAEKYADTGEVADLQYIAYYGCMSMDMFDGRNVPMMWAAFAEVTDDKTLADMEMLVDTAAQNAEWFEN